MANTKARSAFMALKVIFSKKISFLHFPDIFRKTSCIHRRFTEKGSRFPCIPLSTNCRLLEEVFFWKF